MRAGSTAGGGLRSNGDGAGGGVIGGVDIGGTKIAAAAVASDGRIISRAECATNASHGFESGSAAGERARSSTALRFRKRSEWCSSSMACAR